MASSFVVGAGRFWNGFGFTIERSTGRTMMPWKSPNDVQRKSWHQEIIIVVRVYVYVCVCVF